MATQSASLVDVYNYSNTPSMSNMVSNMSLSLVQDPYSGKYYGGSSYKDMLSGIASVKTLYEAQIEQYANTSSYIDMTGTHDPLKEAQASLDSLNAFKIPEEGNYVQQDQMIESYQKYGSGWDKFFESSYKSPRIAEDNARIAQQNLKAQDSSDGTATGNQLIPSNLGIRKESGTGVGKSSTGLNPFGQLDAGLNI